MPIVIYGAGIVGQALVKAGVKAQAFIDNNPNKKVCMKLPVLSVLRFKQMFPEAFVIISTADIQDVDKSLNNYGRVPCGNYLANYQPETPFENYAIHTAINCQGAFAFNELFLHSVDLIITERCSLKCKDCSNLMQYYEHPKDTGTAELLNSIDQLFSVVDEVNEVRVIGGEPFMNKDWHVIVQRLLEEPKLHYVVIYTNGTIVPSHLDVLVNDKAMVLVTDYGHRNTKTLMAELKDHGIPCRVEKVGGWTACGEVKKHNRSKLNNEKVFRDCCVHNLTNLSNGKLYRCPFEANAVRLGLMPDEGQPITTRDDIKAYIKKQSINACDWCNGRPFGAPEITPAIQKGK